MARVILVISVGCIVGCSTSRSPLDAQPLRFESITSPAPPVEPSASPLVAQDAEVLPWLSDENRSHWIPAVEILGFEFLLNQFNRHFIDEDTYGSDLDSIRDNLSESWTTDDDPFDVNQLGHPYAGSMYFGFARSAGQDFWTSLGYSFLGSALWEIAGETTPPSLNDQIATGIGGSFLGEVLFRMASAVLEGAGSDPDGWHELGAALISPSTGFNRLAFGERFDAIFPSRDPATFSRLSLGASQNVHVHGESPSHDVQRSSAIGDYELDYGLPGEPGYHYKRPFDYFNFEATVTSDFDQLFSSFMVRGLLLGEEYGSGSYRAVGGLYGTYDYVSPEVFRVSSTALAAGTTGQWWISSDVALQGTLLGGFGYGAAATIADSDADRDHHYGVMPQGLLALRLFFGDRIIFDAAARDWYLSGRGSDEIRGAENIYRLQAALMVRVWERHSIGLQWIESHREANFRDGPDQNQTVETIGIVYTCLLGSAPFGGVEWRDGRQPAR